MKRLWIYMAKEGVYMTWGEPFYDAYGNWTLQGTFFDTTLGKVQLAAEVNTTIRMPVRNMVLGVFSTLGMRLDRTITLDFHQCANCNSLGYYWSEGNPDMAAAYPEIKMIACSEPFDGTICIQCPNCKGSGLLCLP